MLIDLTPENVCGGEPCRALLSYTTNQHWR